MKDFSTSLNKEIKLLKFLFASLLKIQTRTDFSEIVTKSICKFSKLANNKPLQKIPEICQLPSYKNFFLTVNRKGIFFIWVKLESNYNSELK